MRYLKHIGVYMLFVFITFICWIMCILNAEKIQQLDTIVDLRYSYPQISAKQIQNALQKEIEINSITAYTQYNDQIVETEYKRINEITNLNVYGEINNIFNYKLLNGNYPSLNDYQGCAIDLNTAHEIWGDTDITGFELNINNKKYIVRGVFDYPQKVIITQAEVTYEKVFDSIRISFLNNQNTYEQVQTFISKYNLGNPIIDDISPYAIVFSQIAILPIIFILLIIIINIFKLFKNSNKDLKSMITNIFISIIIILLIVNLINLKIQIPSIYIPTKWSNFEFFERTFDNIQQSMYTLERLSVLITSSKSTIKMLFTNFIFTIIFLICTLKLLQIDNTKDFLYYGVATLIAIFFAVILTGGISERVIQYKTLWSILIIYILTKLNI